MCDKCKKSFSKSNFSRHVCPSDDDINNIRNLYSAGLTLRQVKRKGYSRHLIDYALKDCCTSLSRAMTLSHKNKPRKLSDTTKEKIRQKQVAYLKLKTRETAIERRQKGKMSYGEQWLHDLFVKNDIYKKYDVVNEYCEYPYFLDFAFINEKVDVEFDGNWHFVKSGQDHDRKRDEYLQQKGWRIYRIAHHEIKNFNLQLLIEFIGNANKKKHSYELIKYCDLRKEKKLQNIKKKQQKKQQKFQEKQKRKINAKNIKKSLIEYKELIIQQSINNVFKSNIDFSKFGWVNKVAKIIGQHPQKVNKWMKKYMFSFYKTKCFKKVKHNKTITDVILNQIIDDYKNNVALYQICQKYNLGSKKINRLLLNNNINLRKKGYNFTR